MRKDKLAFTMDLLGEAVITEEEAQAYLQRYLDLMEQLSKAARNWKTVEAIDVAGWQGTAQGAGIRQADGVLLSV
jgi:RHH-type proline utilization regulon transcriptional repressor/proline dehydrogenase/delta 1-pyrroline-5-carboxylate dehydrogenase